MPQLEQAQDVALYLIDVGVEQPQNFALGALQLSAETMPENSHLIIRTTVSVTGIAATVEAEEKAAVELWVEDLDPTLPVLREREVVLPTSRVQNRQEVDLADNGSADRRVLRQWPDQGHAACRTETGRPGCAVRSMIDGI